ncbi:hypothetical protein [Terriglobus sp. RCC_193]|uniref:phosphoribosyltransferase-like protein n=1 Tax=Terriglobus sp. RCC_193 TaxID=3239218 RepID=UPI003525AE6A
MREINQKLLLTERGQQWVGQFDDEDVEAASQLVWALTLVSHSSFQRDLSRRILDTATKVGAPVAFFSAREIEDICDFAKKLNAAEGPSEVDGVNPGHDLGSEARVAATIRSLCKTNPSQLLNHPNKAEMVASQCDAIIVVDDLIGSGKRVCSYLDALWDNRSLRSWKSRSDIRFIILAYAVTEAGLDRVSKHKCAPEVIYGRICPTLRTVPWFESKKDLVSGICKKYGARVAAKSFILGFRRSSALLIFEHGCPNNVPAILWSDPAKNKQWVPLFPSKAVLPPETSAFPLEIVRRDPLDLLIDAGQTRLAGTLPANLSLSQETLLILAFAEKGIRTPGALSFATGLTESECATHLKSCMNWGLLTQRLRLTSSGSAELRAAQRSERVKVIAPLGNDGYYPQMLRKTT